MTKQIDVRFTETVRGAYTKRERFQVYVGEMFVGSARDLGKHGWALNASTDLPWHLFKHFEGIARKFKGVRDVATIQGIITAEINNKPA